MPSSGADVAQPHEPKNSGGLAGVLKSLTGGRTAKQQPSSSALNSKTPAAAIHFAEQLNKAPSVLSDGIYGGPVDYESLVNRLGAEQPLAERISAAESLCTAIAEYSVTGVPKIWYAGKDLIKEDKPEEARHAGFRLLTACVKYQASDLERREYFETFKQNLHPNDFGLQLSALVELARNGKDLSGFHYDAFPLLTVWLRAAFLAYEQARSAAKAAGGRSARRTATAEENNLHCLFDFINNVIKFNCNVAGDDVISRLLEAVLHIALQARSTAELEACINVIDNVVTFGSIPATRLRDCLKVLCSIYALVRDARPQAWKTVSNLCRSHNGHHTIEIMLDLLRYPGENIREIKGALAVLELIFLANGDEGYPLVSFGLLMDAIKSCLVTAHPKVDSEILHLVLALLGEDNMPVSEAIQDEDWTVMLDIAATCSSRIHETSDGRPVESRSGTLSPTPSVPSSMHSTDSATSPATSLAQTMYSIITKIEHVLMSEKDSPSLHKEECIAFFAGVHDHLPEACAKLVIDFYDESRFCYPSDPNWKGNIHVLLDAFFNDRTRPTSVRLLTLKAITDVYDVVEMMDTGDDSDLVYNFISGILSNLAEETDVEVLQHIVSFAVAVADNAEPEVFEYIMRQLRHTISHDRMHSPVIATGGRTQNVGQEPQPNKSSPSNIITRGLISIYMRAMDNDAEKAVQTFEEILRIAKSSASETDARISAMQMLFRIRADWANRVFLTPFTESDGLAASLYRTAASLARKKEEDEAAQQQLRSSRDEDMKTNSLGRGVRVNSSTQLNLLGKQTVSRASSSVSRTLQLNHQQMWMTPDPNALPAHVSGRASVLYAYWEPELWNAEKPLPPGRKVLRIAGWLEIVTTLISQGCDWEIYSYILVHLPAQLANPGVFKAAGPQIKELRKILCDQLTRNTIHEPASTSGLRKADVAVCVVQSLTMLISYHGNFYRNEEDEMVKAFVQGLTAWERTAKSCIHALSICCHELPSSMRSSLHPALAKMSSIVTQSSVAVHVLEFLACLARLPELYSNFRDDDYMYVFGICFRYLQSVREKSPEYRSSSSRHGGQGQRSGTNISEQGKSIPEPIAGESNFVPNTSDDLPQYVFSLAYHVIIFWFLALRLPDRGGHVSWIIKNLVGTDDSGKQYLDEQSQVAIDFMQRTAFANVDESRSNPDFVGEKYGEILKRRWIVGQSLITIEQASHNDWAQVTKRQASATSHYMVHERFERPPPHQELSIAGRNQEDEMNMVLPSYLLLQLSSTLSMSDHHRPIPLPDDDMVRRAIQSFDRISTVDGHKVGLIYIGEGQTQEIEILANVMGSSDYTEFLEGLGTLTKLQGAKFNTQGLDRQMNVDGEYTFCWRDRVTEIVFHVTTLMPTNLDHDPQCIGKKKHIGNDFVNIVFNNSGLPFKFDTFPSAFNYVYIVITPESRASFVATRIRTPNHAENTFYRVQVISKPGFPEISPAAETKLVSLKALPDFIRLLALNASVFSLVWANRQGGDHVSSWRTRLREITRLRDKYASSAGSTKAAPGSGMTSSANNGLGSSSAAQDANRPRDSLISSRRASVATFMTGITSTSDHKDRGADDHNDKAKDQRENMVETLDFSRWA